MAAYEQWTRSYFRDIIRRELMDTNTRWFSNVELNLYLNDWVGDLQEEFEFVWGSATITTTTNTLTLSTLTPTPLRVEGVYYNNFRLSGRSLQDLEVRSTFWREDAAATPKLSYMYDTQNLILHPPISGTGTIILEYPQVITLSTDTATCPFPIWTQYSAKPYVCAKVFNRPGPINDIAKARRYESQYTLQHELVKEFWHNFQPERFRKLKPQGDYEVDIIFPRVPTNVSG